MTWTPSATRSPASWRRGPAIRKRRYRAFKGSNLAPLLKAREIQTIIATGVYPPCVENTPRDGFEIGSYVCIPRDGVASWDMSLDDATLQAGGRWRSVGWPRLYCVCRRASAAFQPIRRSWPAVKPASAWPSDIHRTATSAPFGRLSRCEVVSPR